MVPKLEYRIISPGVRKTIAFAKRLLGAKKMD